MLPKILAAASFGIFLLSLLLPGFYYAGGDPTQAMPGIVLLSIGWSGLNADIFAWLGNPLLLGAWGCFFMRKAVLSVALSTMAILAMLEFRRHLHQTFDFGSSKTSTIAGCGPGYYFWLASSVLMLGASVSALLLKKNELNQTSEPTATNGRNSL